MTGPSPTGANLPCRVTASSAELRAALVSQLVDSGVLAGDAVRQAFAAVPRELFVPALAAVRGLPAIYADEHLITRERDGQPTSSSSQPSIMALMLDALDVRPGHRVLEVGLGTGYNAALLSHVVGPSGQVTSIDVDPGVVAEAASALRAGGYPVTALVGDGRLGHLEGAPYDRIIVTASAMAVPRAWWEQLAPDGLLVVPIRVAAVQLIAVLDRTSTGFTSRRLIRGGFMPLRGGDANVVDADAIPTLSIRTSVPGRASTSVSVQGPAVAQMPPDGLGSLAANLLHPPTIEDVDWVPGWPAIWHAVMTTDLRRQISLYGLPGGVRLGLVDPYSGAFATLVAQRVSGDWTVCTIESYGPADSCAADLRQAIDSWTTAGSPPFERLTLTITYDDSAGSGALLAVVRDDQVLTLDWTGEQPQ
jgi:protein-L-isoaspartate(D-aspartate) O-methyltransferase